MGDYELSYGGISFRLEGDNLVVSNEYSGRNVDGKGVLKNMPSSLVVIKPKMAGVGTTFKDTEFLLQASIDFVDDDNDGNKNDIKLGVFINGVLYNNMYFVIKDDAENLGTKVNFNGGKVAVAESYDYGTNNDKPAITLDNSPESAFDFWTFADLRIVDQTSSERLNWDPKQPSAGNSLNKTVFNGKINFPEGSDSFGNYYFGSDENWYGFAVLREGTDGLKLYYNCKETGHFHNNTGDTGTTAMTNTQIAVFNPLKAGTKLRGNDDLQFSLSVEYVNERDNYTDLKVGVFFDGKLYNGKYYTVKDVPKSELVKNLAFYVQNNAEYTIKSIGKTCIADQAPLDHNNITLTDAEIFDASKGTFSGDFDLETLDGTLFSTKIKYSEEKSRLHLGLGDYELSYGGISFRLEGDNLVVSNEYSGRNVDGKGVLKNMPSSLVVIKPKMAGVGTTFKDTEFLLQVSIDFVDDDGDGNKNDIKLGVFINGSLYNNMYFVIKDDAENLGTKINFNGGKVAVAESYDYGTNNDKPAITLDNSPESAFDFWTFADLRIVDQTSSERLNWDPKQPSAGNSLNKTVFNGKINFPEGSDSFGNYYFGSDENWYGFAVLREGTDGLKLYYNCKETGHFHNNTGDTGTTAMTNTQIAVFNPLKAGTKLRGNDDLQFSLSVEYVNERDNYTDLKVGVFFDGKLYNGKYYTVKDVPKSELVKNLAFYVQNNAEYTIKSIGKTCLVDKAPADRKNITLMDAGVLDVNNGTFAGKFDLDTLDGTLFSTTIKYNVDGSRLHLGFGDPDLTFGGISFRLSGDNIVVSNEYQGRSVEGYGVLKNMPSSLVVIKPKMAGVGTTFKDTEFLLQASIDFVDNDGDGDKNDIKLGVFINGLLYNNMYFIIKDDALNLGTRVNFNSGKVASIKSYNYEGYYTELNASDFGIYGKAVENSELVAVYDGNSLDKTAITMNMKFSSSGKVKILFGGEYSGIALEQLSSDKLSLYYIDKNGKIQSIAELTAKKAGLDSFAGKQNKWRFAFRVTPQTEDSAYLKLGIYINGVLYNGSFFTLNGVDIDSLKRVIKIDAQKGKLSMSDNEYEELTIKDFSVKNTVVTEIQKKDYRTENYCDLETLDGTAFSATCCFPKNGLGRFTLGSPFWFGAFMSSTADGRIQVAHCDTDKTVRNFVYLDAKTAGLTSFTDSDFTVRLTFDILDNGNGKSDLNLGIYINGKLYNGQHYCVRNIDAATLTRNLQIYATATPFTIKSSKSSTDLSVYGFTNNGWKKQLGIG